ncbi:MAG TPA: tRNA epoxyqueuosine(34) reductase QueG [Polyangiaceae bacterium]|jgi:epoxyqueuosine reductase
MTAAVSTAPSREARTALVKARARALGFDAVGIARAEPLEREHARYAAFVARGFHGEMSWLARDEEDVRKDVRSHRILEGARSVICLASAYQRSAEDEAHDPPLAKLVARYARGRDYHNGLKKKLRKLAAFVRTLEEGASARPLSDDAPILERAWAARAGLGFIGKNGLLIVPGRGSFVLLGEVVTSLDLEPDAPLPERCGTCTRCIDACPTRAIVEPFVLDARKCISYLTIELRGAMPVTLREGVGDHLFGCDDCQTVCPFTHGKAETHETPERYAPLARWATTSLESLLALEDGSEAWAAVGRGTPLHRATAEGLARNAAIVLGNRRDAAARLALERAAESHPAESVRDAARWALARIS